MASRFRTLESATSLQHQSPDYLEAFWTVRFLCELAVSTMATQHDPLCVYLVMVVRVTPIIASFVAALQALAAL